MLVVFLLPRSALIAKTGSSLEAFLCLHWKRAVRLSDRDEEEEQEDSWCHTAVKLL